MSKTARRQLSRLVGASCLAAAVAFPTAAFAAPGAVPEAPNAPVADTPEPPNPPSPEPPEPQEPQEPQEPEPEPQVPDAPEPEPQAPDAPEPDQPNAPDGGTPSQGEPGTPSQGGPGAPPEGGTPPEGGSTPPQELQEFYVGVTEDQIKTQIAALEVPAEVKTQLGDGLATALKVIYDRAASPQERSDYTAMMDSLHRLLSGVEDLKSTSAEKAAYTNIARGLNEAVLLSKDPTLSADQQAKNQVTARKLAFFVSLALAEPPPANRAELLKGSNDIAGGLLAVKEPETAPEKPEDKQKIEDILREKADAVNGAVAVLQNPNATPEEKQAAQRTLQEQVATPGTPGTPGNPGSTTSVEDAKYLEFLAEVKTYDPPQACLDAIQNRTAEAGWPEGSLWGLTDDSCAAMLAKAAADDDSKWNELFECVVNEAFTTCTAYIPQN